MSHPFGVVHHDERACRICGCTEFNACVDELTGQPCHWVAADLCSACVAPELDQFVVEQYWPPATPLWVTGLAACVGTVAILCVVYLSFVIAGSI